TPWSSAAPYPVILQRELVILAQRMPFPIFRKQDAPQVRVAGKPDAAKVVDFALVPVSDAPNAGHGRHVRQIAGLVALPARQDKFDGEAVLVRETLQMIDHLQVRLEARLRRFL